MIAGYQILSQIGSGARSTIHKAVDSRDGTICALKRVIRKSGDDDRFIDQARTEYEVGSQVDHPHVRRCCAIHPVMKGKKVKELYVALEYVDGLPLETARPNRLDGFLQIMRKVVLGLDALHRAGYLHADMKPQNVMLGANGVVGANILIAAGAAHAIKLKRESRIVACIFGDGAINRGPFLEGLNWARVFDLPVLFVCEDNGFASTTRTASMSGGPGAVARAESLGIPAVEVDGNDIAALHEAVCRAIAQVRAGGGPSFLLARTYRLAGHTSADAGAYRPAEEVERAWERDPIANCRRKLLELGVAEETLQQAERAGEVEIAAAFETACHAPWPDIAAAYEDVQDAGAVVRGGR